jgi:pimeloyl-ACP methyl ester carboxylesterase
MPIICVNGTEIYHEIHGTGPPVLLVMGATGDAGHFDKIADLLAGEFTVLTYDRRGNGRSPRPDGWTTTSVEEHADDAAALLDALGLAPAAVFATSSGAVFTLELMVGHPQAVRGAILHEPALYALFDDPTETGHAIAAVVSEGMASGGPPAALERFWRFVAGDANWDNLAGGLRRRMLASADTYLAERAAIASYLPNGETLNALALPIQVLISEQSRPIFHEPACRLVQRLNVPVSWTPGSHTPYLDHPDELVRTIRPFLRQVSGVPG